MREGEEFRPLRSSVHISIKSVGGNGHSYMVVRAERNFQS